MHAHTTGPRVRPCATLLVALFAWHAPQAGAQTAGAVAAKPVRIVVPFPAGGPVDVLARVIAQKLAEAWAQPVLVENRAGAGGGIGAEFVARSAPDGHTVLISIAGTITIQPHLAARKTYDPLRDLAPVTQLVTFPFVLVTNPSVPARNARELVALAKAKPARINFATSGIGTDYHLATELFKSLARVDIVPVPYKGGAPSMTAIIGGEADAGFQVISTALPFIAARKLMPLAVTSGKRAAVLPRVPALAESGVPGFDTSGWWGIFVPAGTPPDAIERLRMEIGRILSAPALRERLTGEGFEIALIAPAPFAEFLRTDSARWARVVRDAKITLE
jgi:tripartite-type tricarboxylate transporter receptor subunit TctC